MENELTHDELLIRYFAGETNDEENRQLAEWIRSNPANLKSFEEYRAAFQLVSKSVIELAADLNHEWAMISPRLTGIREPRKEKVSFFFTYGRALRIAALVIILLIPVFFLIRYLSKPGTVTLGPKNEMADVVLSDGTRVVLKPGSVLEYPRHFRDDTRPVILKGEAFLSIGHDPSHPFILSLGNTRIEDIGTAFYANSRPMNGQAKVILTSGKIAVYFNDRPGEKKILDEGEKAEIGENDIIVSKNTDINYLAWKTRKIIFMNDPLDKVIETLDGVYQSDIRLKDPVLTSCRLTATFDNQSLESVLNVIRATLDLNIKKSGTFIEISGNGCN